MEGGIPGHVDPQEVNHHQVAVKGDGKGPAQGQSPGRGQNRVGGQDQSPEKEHVAEAQGLSPGRERTTEDQGQSPGKEHIAESRGQSPVKSSSIITIEGLVNHLLVVMMEGGLRMALPHGVTQGPHPVRRRGGVGGTKKRRGRKNPRNIVTTGVGRGGGSLRQTTRTLRVCLRET